MPCNFAIAKTTTIQGDIGDKASLKHAFQGAHSVFAVTNYWEKMDDKLELQQGKNVADAAKVCTVFLCLS